MKSASKSSGKPSLIKRGVCLATFSIIVNALLFLLSFFSTNNYEPVEIDKLFFSADVIFPAYAWVTYGLMYNSELKLVESIVHAPKCKYPKKVH